MAHYAIRGLLQETALKAVRVVKRKLPVDVALPPVNQKAFHESVLKELLQDLMVSSRGRAVPQAVKRQMSNYRLRNSAPMSTLRFECKKFIKIIK